MKTYKVIALSLGGIGNKIFSSGDLVSESNFIEGRASELEAQGFLVEEKESEVKTEKPSKKR